MGARIPEELETLLEDALVVGDRAALEDMFEPRATFVTGLGTELRGRDEIVRYLRVPFVGARHRVIQSGHTALLLGVGSVAVVRRGRDRAWRYAIRVPDALRPGGSDHGRLFAPKRFVM